MTSRALKVLNSVQNASVLYEQNKSNISKSRESDRPQNKTFPDFFKVPFPCRLWNIFICWRQITIAKEVKKPKKLFVKKTNICPHASSVTLCLLSCTHVCYLIGIREPVEYCLADFVNWGWFFNLIWFKNAISSPYGCRGEICPCRHNYWYLMHLRS